MAPKKKVMAVVTLQIKAAAATPAPPVGTALGQHGVNIMEFVQPVQRRHAAVRGAGDPGGADDLRGPQRSRSS